MKGIFATIFAFYILLGCSEHKAQRFSSVEPMQNIYRDKIMQKIHDLKDKRDTEKLSQYLQHSEANYRSQAALAFGSVQDTTILNDLYQLVMDPEAEVQRAAAFAIGQTGSGASEEYLIALSLKNDNPIVKAEIYEAIGKCGSERGLNYLSDLAITHERTTEGLLWGFARFSIKGITNSKSTSRVLDLLKTENLTEYQRYVASIYFNRLKVLTPEQLKDVSEIFSEVEDQQVKENLINVLAKNYSKRHSSIIDSALKSNNNNILINILRSLPEEAYFPNQSRVEELLKHSNINVAISASEFFLRLANKKHARRYLSLASPELNWRVGTTLFHAALKASPSNETTIDAIMTRYKNSMNIYEKAFLLRALGEDIGSFKFLAKETFGSEEKIISAYGMEALVHMRESEKFDYHNDRYKSKGGSDLYQEFALILKQAISSNETSLVAQAAQVLRVPGYNYINTYSNTYFLKQALHRLEVPEQLEAFVELKKTIAYFEGEEYDTKNNSLFNNPINWKLVQTIDQNELAVLETNKGKITLALKVNEAPGTVANFLRLSKDDFYNQLTTHRVVPNFVVQGGCPRGDGWGETEFSIRSEFSFLKYSKGSVGMASAGKDTESSQWFITHSATPHLDGRYTIFAEVVDGIDIVNRLEIGDRIIDVKIH